MTTFTIISKQDTYVEWSHCSGYEGTHEGGFFQEWFNDRDKALDYWVERLIHNKYVVPTENNDYEYENTLYIDGKSTTISWSNLIDDNEEYDRLSRIEEDFLEDARIKFIEKEKHFLAKREADKLEKERIQAEALATKQKELAEKQKQKDLETLSRLQAQYGKGS